jgi:hypothetical protein
MNRQLHDMGFQTMISVWPRFTRESRYYDEILKKGWFEHLADGTPTDGLPYDRAGSDIDTTNPDAARWFWETIRDNILYNSNPNHGGFDFTNATDVADTDSDYNIFGGGNWAATPDDGTTFYTLSQWQSLGHDPHSFVATLSSLFVNPSANDYRLLATSPAVDAGQTLPSVTTDIEGTPRPQGTAWDIGCYEYPK